MAAALAAVVTALAGAGSAFGQSVDARGVGTGATDAAAAASGAQQGVQQQAAQQVSEAAQDAAAQATAVQTNPVNVAAPKVNASPGAETTVEQANDAAAAAGAANQVDTTQGSGQVQTGGAAASGAGAGSGGAQPAPSDPAPSDPAPSASAPPKPRPSERPPAQNQSGTQSAGTTQVAGAQATTVQTQPINVAVPMIVASPGANITVIQSNNASSAASATNSTFTTQVANQAQLGDWGKGQASVPKPSLPPSERSPTGPGDATGPGSGPGGVSLQQFLNTIVQSGGSALVWNWNWNVEINVPSIPGWKPSDLEAPPVSWTPSEADRQPAEESRQVADRSRADAEEKSPAPHALGAAASDAVPPADLNARNQAKQNVSSNFVQQDQAMPLEPLIFPPLEPQAVPGSAAGSGGVAPLPLVGALLAVAFAIAAGLLGRRLALRGAGLRRQTSLSPLERPG